MGLLSLLHWWVLPLGNATGVFQALAMLKAAPLPSVDKSATPRTSLGCPISMRVRHIWEILALEMGIRGNENDTQIRLHTTPAAHLAVRISCCRSSGALHWVFFL